MIFSLSLSTMFSRFCLTVAIFSASMIFLPGIVSSNTDFISGLTASCAEDFTYCSKKPVSWYDADFDCSVSSDSLDDVISQRTIKIATTATKRNTASTLLPTWNKISSAIRLCFLVSCLIFFKKSPSSPCIFILP